MGGPEAVAEVKVEVPAAPDTPTEGEDVKNEDVILPVQENKVEDDSSPEEAPVPIDAPEVEESPIVNEVEDTELKADKQSEEVEEPLIVADVATTTGGDGPQESEPEEVGEPLIVGEVDEPLLVAKVA